MRGLPGFYSPFDHVWGIIPARAGFTGFLVARRAGIQDHPRACGVYLFRLTNTFRLWGSSPRVRGLPLMRHTQEANERIIPARAGFTSGVFRG